MSAAVPIRARTPSRTIRLSSARNTEIFWAGIPLFEPHRSDWSREAATKSLRMLARRQLGGVPDRPHRPRRYPEFAAVCAKEEVWAVRIESSVTSVSWIPSEAIGGIMRAPFDLGPMHYDNPPPDQIDDVQALAHSGSVRFINHQRAWIEVENGSIVYHGQSGRGWMGRTKLGFGSLMILYPTTAMPDLRSEPASSDQSVRFVQTTGGRPAIPLPRKLNRPPFVQIIPPIVWTTLALPIDADGSATHDAVRASPFPRHWIYDASGKLVS